MTVENISKPNSFGFGAMAIATLALVIAVVHLSFGPFKPQKPIETQIAETAVKIKDAAIRALSGQQTAEDEPVAQSSWDIDRVTDATVIAFAALAMGLGLIALVRGEQHRPAFTGFSLGASVLLVLWLQWIALLICGVILLAAIIGNLDAIISS